MVAKPISIKDAKRKSGGCAWKAVELIERSAARLGFGTEGGVIHPDPAAEVSSGRSTHGSEGGPSNSKSE